jgi:hypothetical protein
MHASVLKYSFPKFTGRTECAGLDFRRVCCKLFGRMPGENSDKNGPRFLQSQKIPSNYIYIYIYIYSNPL